LRDEITLRGKLLSRIDEANKHLQNAIQTQVRLDWDSAIFAVDMFYETSQTHKAELDHTEYDSMKEWDSHHKKGLIWQLNDGKQPLTDHILENLNLCKIYLEKRIYKQLKEVRNMKRLLHKMKVKNKLFGIKLFGKKF
jgi:hypothetical protein